mmetsp:Transcript_74637/g.187941  ORF Transcript_74637/g.187941 Transcript_74637/m.187941 type:complete len:99 (+) Transcript_74637:991-1287(+)
MLLITTPDGLLRAEDSITTETWRIRQIVRKRKPLPGAAYTSTPPICLNTAAMVPLGKSLLSELSSLLSVSGSAFQSLVFTTKSVDESSQCCKGSRDIP